MAQDHKKIRLRGYNPEPRYWSQRQREEFRRRIEKPTAGPHRNAPANKAGA